MDVLIWIAKLISALLPSLIVSLVMAVINRRQKRREAAQDAREAAQDARAEARKQESLLHLNLQMATAKLSYATAMALKRGKANGEVEEGVDAYEEAKSEYYSFLNQQATEHLNQ